MTGYGPHPKEPTKIELTLGRVFVLFLVLIAAMAGMVVASVLLAAQGRDNTADQIRAESNKQFLQGCSSGNVARAGQILQADRIDSQQVQLDYQQRQLSAIAQKLGVELHGPKPDSPPTLLADILTGIPSTVIRDCVQTVSHDNLPVPLPLALQRRYIRIVELSRTPQIVYDRKGNPHVR